MEKWIEATIIGYVKGKGLLPDFYAGLKGMVRDIQGAYEECERIIIDRIKEETAEMLEYSLLDENPAAVAEYINQQWSGKYAFIAADYIRAKQQGRIRGGEQNEER